MTTTPPRTSHPWAVLDGDVPLWHVPGSWPPKFEINNELETLWRAKQKKPRKPVVIQLSLWEKAA